MEEALKYNIVFYVACVVLMSVVDFESLGHVTWKLLTNKKNKKKCHYFLLKY